MLIGTFSQTFPKYSNLLVLLYSCFAVCSTSMLSLRPCIIYWLFFDFASSCGMNLFLTALTI
jgi:hypothetical protein